MARLITVLEAMASLGMDPKNEDTLTDTVNSAIDKATLLISQRIGSPLAKASYQEVFLLEADLFSGVIPAGFIGMKTYALCLDKETPIVAVVKSAWDGEETAILNGDILVNWTLGVVRVPAVHIGKYVTITYTAGYDGPTDVASDLKQAIMSVLPMVFRSSQFTTDAEEEPKNKSSAELTQGLISKYFRLPGFLYRSLQVTEV